MENTKIFKTPDGAELLTEWSDRDFTRFYHQAAAAARRLLPELEFIHGRIENTVYNTFGLPYTSSGDFAAVWNTNTEARIKNTPLYFEGVAINKDFAAVGVFTELDADGNEIGTVYREI